MNVGYVIVAILVAIMGLFAARHPEKTIHINSLFKDLNLEPTETYLTMIRSSGIVLVFMAAIAIISLFSAY